MWFDSKYRINRGSGRYPRVKKERKTSDHNLHKHYHMVKEDIHQFIEDLNKTASIPYSKLKKYILAIIQELLEAICFSSWSKVLSVEHKFEFLVSFITNLKIYHDISLGEDENKKNRERIQAFHFPRIMEERLIKLNHLRNKICHELYELTHQDEVRIEMGYFQWLIFLLEKEFKPITDSLKGMENLTAKDYISLLTEIKIYMHNYFVADYPNNEKYREEISAVLNEVFT